MAVPIARQEWRRAGLLAAAATAGVGLATLVARAASGGVVAADRATAAGGAGRFDAWVYGWHAFLDRPLLGWGPGGYRESVQGRFDADFTSLHARNEVTDIWFDAHNVIVHSTVTLGLVGIVLVAAFVALNTREARGPLAVFAAVVAITWLLEPPALSTLPITMLALGAATVRRAEAMWRPSIRQPVFLVLAVGALVATSFVMIDLNLRRAVDSGDPRGIENAAQWLPWDPVAADFVATSYQTYGTSEESHDRVVEWLDEAIARHSTRTYYYNRLAGEHIGWGEYDAAEAVLARSLSIQPWNVQSLRLLDQLGERSGRTDLTNEARAKLCRMDLDDCP